MDWTQLFAIINQIWNLALALYNALWPILSQSPIAAIIVGLFLALVGKRVVEFVGVGLVLWGVFVLISQFVRPPHP